MYYCYMLIIIIMIIISSSSSKRLPLFPYGGVRFLSLSPSVTIGPICTNSETGS